MKATNLIQLAREKKMASVLGFLKLAFNDFAYPVYLFGSYATGEFHGYSDVDILIISPDALSTKVYHQACSKMAESGMSYDILVSPSLNRLDDSIINSLKAINIPSVVVGRNKTTQDGVADFSAIS
ncbi:MAG: nucleotidyltransferase domain-containing protein [Methylococcaceae bacterium]